MSATTLDLTIEQGADWSIQVPVLDAAGNPVDLTGYTAHAELRPSQGSPVVLADLTVGSGITVTPLTGILTFSLTHTQTAALAAPQDVGVWDCFLTDGAGAVSKLLTGTVTILPEVTR